MSDPHTAGVDPRTDRTIILDRYRRIRAFTEDLCRTLQTEDYVIQSMADVSPTRWHLAHTSWFFETFLLQPHLEGYRVPDEQYGYLFNSYYNAIGAQFDRPSRGLLSRPTVAEVYEYRRIVDEAMVQLVQSAPESAWGKLHSVIEVGLNHEQQHQELMLTDIKHVFSVNPLRPAFCEPAPVPSGAVTPAGWAHFDEGIRSVGHGDEGFAYDNEGPRHRVFLEPFRLSTRLVTSGEYRAFIADGGYEKSELWLDAGWAVVREKGWRAPIYWEQRDGEWMEFTLAGMRPLQDDTPVCHVSYFEADAYARWAGARLPTEFEWEAAVGDSPIEGNFVDDGVMHPVPARGGKGVTQAFGDVWEWTMSHYSPYPGYRPAAGAIGEYNGKWMCGQFVLRGGSCATTRDHMRLTYRNFFGPAARWQFSGIRLADGLRT